MYLVCRATVSRRLDLHTICVMCIPETMFSLQHWNSWRNQTTKYHSSKGYRYKGMSAVPSIWAHHRQKKGKPTGALVFLCMNRWRTKACTCSFRKQITTVISIKEEWDLYLVFSMSLVLWILVWCLELYEVYLYAEVSSMFQIESNAHMTCNWLSDFKERKVPVLCLGVCKMQT